MIVGDRGEADEFKTDSIRFIIAAIGVGDFYIIAAGVGYCECLIGVYDGWIWKLEPLVMGVITCGQSIVISSDDGLLWNIINREVIGLGGGISKYSASRGIISNQSNSIHAGMTVGMGRISQGAGAAATEFPEIGGGIDAGIGEGNMEGLASSEGIYCEGTNDYWRR